MKTAIIILNWNGGADTINCLSSLLPVMTEEDSLFVVDNGSADRSVNEIEKYLLEENFPARTVISSDIKGSYLSSQRCYIVLNGKNLGFGGGNNVVLRQLSSLDKDFKYAWLLNNDAVVVKDSLLNLKKALLSSGKNAVAGSVILNYPDNGLIQCSGVKHFRFFGVSKLINKNQSFEILKNNPDIKFDYLNGASLLFNLHAMNQAGYFDERFFLYSEEFDLQMRIQQAGYNLILAQDSLVYHKLSGGTGRSRHLFFYYYNTSAIFLSKKHFGVFFTFCATFNLVLITAVRALPSFKNFSWGIKGIWKGLSGR